jgi:RNase P/RNase MRP subunit p29
MKTKELGWKDNQDTQTIGIEGNVIVDQRHVLKVTLQSFTIEIVEQKTCKSKLKRK